MEFFLDMFLRFDSFFWYLITFIIVITVLAFDLVKQIRRIKRDYRLQIYFSKKKVDNSKNKDL